MILENKIKCRKCGDIIRSENVHDYRSCKCGACAVDGGHLYLKRVGELEDWEEMSVVKEYKWEKIVDDLVMSTFGIKSDEKVEVTKSDLDCIISNLRRCALGWAWATEQIKLKG